MSEENEEVQVDISDEVMGLADEEQQLAYEKASEEERVHNAVELTPNPVKEEEPSDVQPDEEAVEDEQEEEADPEEAEDLESSDDEAGQGDGEGDGEADLDGDATDEVEDDVDPRDEVIENLKRLINEGASMPLEDAIEADSSERAEQLEQAAGEELRTIQNAPATINLDGLSEDDKDKVASGDLSPLAGVLNEALAQNTEYSNQQLITAVSHIVENRITVQRQIERFWEDPKNEDVADMRDYVIRIAAQNDDPSKSVTDVLNDSAESLRKVLQVKEAKDKQKKRSAKGPKAFAGKTRRPVKAEKATPKVTKDQQELIDLLSDLEEN